MNRRSGFTLMELLLVVAVLAIVAAAAAPTFFGGASQAMNEARKSGFLSAYTNTLSGASMYISIQGSKGIEPTTGMIAVATLDGFVPTAARTFKKADGTTDVTLNAYYDSATKKVSVFYGATYDAANLVTPDDAGWNKVK